MAGSFLKLDGDFDASKNYILKGSTLISWREALIADRVVPGPNLTESQTPQGRIFSAQAGSGDDGGHPFKVSIADNVVTVQMGALFVSSAFYGLTVDGDSASASLTDGNHTPSDQLAMIEPKELASKDGTIGVWLCTDHLGAPQWAAIEWDDLHGTQSHNSIGGSYAYGLYFWPLAEILTGEIERVILKSDIFWNVTSLDLSGTTVPTTPPTPPTPPSAPA
jgi:hypothetical protein